MSGGVLQYTPPGQVLDGGNFSAFIMAAMLDSQVLQNTALFQLHKFETASRLIHGFTMTEHELRCEQELATAVQE